MAVQFTSQEIARKYDRFAPWFDFIEGIPDLLGVRRLRNRLLRRASGKVLEVAVGTGKNLRYYPRSCKIIAVDISSEMLHRASRRATELHMEGSFIIADSAALPFSHRSFDTVVSTLTTCTFPDPELALREMARVCRPAGRILLVEHGRSDREWFGRWQDRREDSFAKLLGCHWNREPLQIARAAGLTVLAAARSFFGIFHLIETQPVKRKSNQENGEKSSR
jgi:ubiquinone/menaquinone biosynthesis C-methylase UbiE